jgi:hypothetical protein
MKTGRFINKLNNNILAYYGTEDYHLLLNKKNMQTVWNMTSSGENVFPDDLAITYTTITPDFDGSRVIYANDTVILKFDYTDTEFILQTLKDKLDLINRMQTVQAKNGFELKNPLPNITL